MADRDRISEAQAKQVWIVYEVLNKGRSIADIARELRVTRQRAHQMYERGRAIVKIGGDDEVQTGHPQSETTC